MLQKNQNRNSSQNRVAPQYAAPRSIRTLAAVLAILSGSAVACGQCIDHSDCCQSSGIAFRELSMVAPGSCAHTHGTQKSWTMLEGIRRPHSVDLPVACFAEGTVLTPELMRQWRQLRNFSAGDVSPNYYFMGVPWNWQSNVGAVVTYSLVPDGTSLSDGYTSSLFSMMDSKFGGDRALWTGYIRACFDAISQVCGARFVQESDDGAPWPSGDGFN